MAMRANMRLDQKTTDDVLAAVRKGKLPGTTSGGSDRGSDRDRDRDRSERNHTHTKRNFT